MTHVQEVGDEGSRVDVVLMYLPKIRNLMIFVPFLQRTYYKYIQYGVKELKFCINVGKIREVHTSRSSVKYIFGVLDISVVLDL